MSQSPVRVLHAVTSQLTVALMRGQLSYLRRTGFDVTVLSAPGPLLDDLAREESIRALPVPMERDPAPLRDLLAFLRIYRRVRALRPDIVNAGTPKAGLLVGLAAWLARVPCRIYMLRGLRFETSVGCRRRLLYLADRVCSRMAHVVICNSPSLRSRAIELGITDEAHSLVLGCGSSNGVVAGRFLPTPPARERALLLRRQLGIPDAAPVVGFVGRLNLDKGIPELVAAYRAVRAEVPELRLLLVGELETREPLPEETRSALDRDPGIICTGAVPDPAPYYHLMTVYALPTHREGFPNSVLEAQAAGLAVVTTRATGAVDSIVDGVTGILVPPGDVDALAQALQRLLRDPALAARMGAAGRERVVCDFRPEPLWEGLADLYRRLRASAGAAGASG